MKTRPAELKATTPLHTISIGHALAPVIMPAQNTQIKPEAARDGAPHFQWPVSRKSSFLARLSVVILNSATMPGAQPALVGNVQDPPVGHAPKTHNMQGQTLSRQLLPIARSFRPTSLFLQHWFPGRQSRKHCCHNCFLKPLVIEVKEPQPFQALTCPSLAPLFCSILEATCAHQLCQNPSSMCKQPGSWCKRSLRWCLSCCCLWAFVVETWPAYLSAWVASCAF